MRVLHLCKGFGLGAMFYALWLLAQAAVPWHPPPVFAAAILVPPPTAEETRIAAVEAAAEFWGADAGVLLAVSRVENPMADPVIRGGLAERGLMQVHPIHRTNGWLAAECGPWSQIDDPFVNACWGGGLWVQKLERCEGNFVCALMAYNGAKSPDKAVAYLTKWGLRYSELGGGG